MKAIRLFAVVCAALFIINPLSAQDSSGVRKVGSIYSYWNQAYDVAVQGNYAYVATGASGLRVVDISDPDSPHEVGICNTCSFTYCVTVEEDLAYLVAGGGLRIIDISDPARPLELGFYDTPGGAEDVVVSDIYAYVACKRNIFRREDGGLCIIDIADPEDPHEIGFFTGELMDIHSVAVSGNYAYLAGSADYNDGMWIVDVSEPEDPHQVGFYGAPWWVYDVEVAGSYAYLGEGSHEFEPGGLLVIDVSNPRNPVMVRRFDTDTVADNEITIDGNYAYIIADGCDLLIVDISSPRHPNQVGSFDPQGEARNVFIAGDCAYLACSQCGIRMVDISNAEQPEEIGSFNKEGSVIDVVLGGDCAYLASDKDGLRVVDISDPELPEEIGFFDVPRSAYKLTLYENYVLTAEWWLRGHGIRIIDVSNPEHPEEVCLYETPGLAEDIAVSGNRAFVAMGDEGLLIIDISNPQQPEEICHYRDLMEVNGVAAAGNYAYIADFQGLSVLDITDPAHPEVVASLEIGEFLTPAELSVAGDYAYLVWNNIWEMYGGFSIIDVSDPENPSHLGYFSWEGYVCDIAFTEDYIFVASGGLRVVNMSDPEYPHEVGFYDTNGSASGVAVAGNLTYVADCFSLGIYDCSEVMGVTETNQPTPTEFALLAAYPNPFNSRTVICYQSPQDGFVSLAVHDLAGRLVQTLFDGDVTSGLHSLVWDARQVPAGIYFVKLINGCGWVRTEKLALVK